MRLIHYLFYAENLFINDFIDPTACSVQCYNCYKVDQGAELKTQMNTQKVLMFYNFGVWNICM